MQTSATEKKYIHDISSVPVLPLLKCRKSFFCLIFTQNSFKNFLQANAGVVAGVRNCYFTLQELKIAINLMDPFPIGQTFEF